MDVGVHIKRDSALLLLRFNRADKKNAITQTMYLALAEALEAANRDDGIGVCVILGSPRIFTAGNDIGDFLRAGADGEGIGAVLRFLHALASLDRPLLAALDGLAVGIGATLLLHCDYVLATPRSVLRTPFTALGLVPEAGSSLLGPRIMGHARAFDLLVMGEDFGAEAALTAGIVNAIVPEDRLEAAILERAHMLAAKPRDAVLAARRLLKGDPAEILARMAEEAELFVQRLASAEAKAAFAAFLTTGPR